MLKNSIEITSSKWLTAEACAAYLQITKKAVYCLVHRGVLPHHKFGRKLYFSIDELDQILLNSRKNPSAPTKPESAKFN